MARAIILVMDSLGIGGAKDAAEYNDEGADTLGHIIDNYPNLKIPNLTKLGLLQAANEASASNRKVAFDDSKIEINSKFGFCNEVSLAKDTTSGHWEIAGVPVVKPWGYFRPEYPSFPDELLQKICKIAKIDGFLGNRAASGTEIIKELGEEHIKTGKPIAYTSADSVFQIAAHEKYFGLQKLYDLCEIAFKELEPYRIARVIARPFVGEEKDNFIRTGNRHDYSVSPFEDTLLDVVKAAGKDVFAVGKISDIFAGCGVTQKLPASGHDALWKTTLKIIKEAPEESLIFTNFVDFDMLYGHRRDLQGYARALEDFDKKLLLLIDSLRENDVVFITADHGNDPTAKGTDHTRERVPVLMFGKNVKSENIGERQTFSDIGQTAAEVLGLKISKGKSFL